TAAELARPLTERRGTGKKHPGGALRCARIVLACFAHVVPPAGSHHSASPAEKFNARGDEWPPAPKENKDVQKRNGDRRTQSVSGDGCGRQTGQRRLRDPLRRHG